jgi:hypothetical protein
VPARLRPLAEQAIADVLDTLDAALAAGDEPPVEEVRAAVKHFLAVLAARHPGKSVEVRVPPYAAVQCVEGARHTRGTPPAVVETDAQTWVDLARGRSDFAAARAAGRVRASGERSDLTPLLPLT